MLEILLIILALMIIGILVCWAVLEAGRILWHIVTWICRHLPQL